MNLNSDQTRECQLEVGTPGGAWIQVQGCLDSGADDNVAPIAAREYALNVRAMSFPRTYRLPNNEQIPAGYQEQMNVRPQIDDQHRSFDSISFYFIDHPNWTQVLVERNTRRRMNVLPEQTFMN